MSSLCEWLAGLCKPQRSTTGVEYYRKELEKNPPGTYDHNTYKQFLNQAIDVEIKNLKSQLNAALQERKTCTLDDWAKQLDLLLKANTAMAQQKAAGINNNTEVGRILINNYWKEYRRLQFLSFSTIDLPEAVVQEIMEKYGDMGDAP